jgi:hypothetical protein
LAGFVSPPLIASALAGEKETVVGHLLSIVSAPPPAVVANQAVRHSPAVAIRQETFSSVKESSCNLLGGGEGGRKRRNL